MASCGSMITADDWKCFWVREVASVVQAGVLPKSGGCGHITLWRISRAALEERTVEHRTEATLKRFGLLNSQDPRSPKPPQKA